LVRRTHQNVLAEMLEKVLAYNIFQIIRVRKKLSESEETQTCSSLTKSNYSESTMVKESRTMPSPI